MINSKITHKCYQCVSYDLWCGICLNPEAESFKNDRELIGEDEPCCHFKLEESFAAAEEEKKEKKEKEKGDV